MPGLRAVRDVAQLIGRLRQVNWLAVAQGVQSIATTAAIIVGGWWTYKTFIEGREPFPKAGLEHALTVVPLTGERTLLHLGITITNKGQRIIRPDYGEIRVQQILPLANCPPPCAREAILSGGDPVLPEETVVRWPVLARWARALAACSTRAAAEISWLGCRWRPGSRSRPAG